MPLRIPKSTQINKKVKKPSVVALKKNIRRSSVWDEGPTLTDNTFICDTSISSSSDGDLTKGSDDGIGNKAKHKNNLSIRTKNRTKGNMKENCLLKDTIILIDSDSDTNEDGKFKQHANILDELYGEEWKKTDELIFSELPYNKTVKSTLATPKTYIKQLKNNVGKQSNKITKETTTPSLKKNKQSKETIKNTRAKNFQGNQNSSTKNKVQEKTNKTVKTPWVPRLQGLCDSDSSEEEDQDANLNGKSGYNLAVVSSDLRSPNYSDDELSESSEKSNASYSPSEYEISDSDSEDLFILNETKESNKILTKKPQVSVYESFLLSLSPHVTVDKCDPSAKLFKSNYQANKTQLTEKLFQLYNEKIFNSLIPKDTLIEWNKNLRKTGGRCSQITKKLRTGEIKRTVRITLSVKILDEPYRLRDTLLHEMCHAACFLINGVNDGHGNVFMSWGRQAGVIFPELPPVKRCHSYKINTKYSYRCLNCGYCYNRHSKSIDMKKKCCGKCHGKLELLVNKSENGEKKSVPVTLKPPSGFALFVKNNYAVYKTPQLKHGEIMKLLGSKFSELKVSVPKE